MRARNVPEISTWRIDWFFRPRPNDLGVIETFDRFPSIHRSFPWMDSRRLQTPRNVPILLQIAPTFGR